MGRDQRARSQRLLLDRYQRGEFRRRAPILYPVIAFFTNGIAYFTTGGAMTRFERLLLWTLALVEIIRQLR